MRFHVSTCIALGVLTFGCKTSHKNNNSSKEVVTSTNTNSVVAPNESSSPAAPTDTTGTSSDSTLATCKLEVSCNQALPDFGKTTGFSKLSNQIVVLADLKGQVHRGRDVMIMEGGDPNLIAKFAYNILFDKDIKGEKVDIYMSKGCAEGWAKLGTGITSENSETPASLDGVVDKGGYVMLPLSKLGVKNLPVGRHRFVLALQANHDYTEIYVDVLPKSSGIVVTDIDGTLTAAENSAATEISGVSPEAYSGAATVLNEFSKRGYHIFYLTARPAFLTASTRGWLSARGFPVGTVRTTPFITGAVDSSAAAFKTAELKLLLKSTGLVPAYAFGNKPSDVKAYSTAGIPKINSYFYKMSSSDAGIQITDDYGMLNSVAQAATSACP